MPSHGITLNLAPALSPARAPNGAPQPGDGPPITLDITPSPEPVTVSNTASDAAAVTADRFDREAIEILAEASRIETLAERAVGAAKREAAQREREITAKQAVLSALAPQINARATAASAPREGLARADAEFRNARHDAVQASRDAAQNTFGAAYEQADALRNSVADLQDTTQRVMASSGVATRLALKSALEDTNLLRNTDRGDPLPQAALATGNGREHAALVADATTLANRAGEIARRTRTGRGGAADDAALSPASILVGDDTRAKLTTGADRAARLLDDAINARDAVRGLAGNPGLARGNRVLLVTILERVRNAAAGVRDLYTRASGVAETEGRNEQLRLPTVAVAETRAALRAAQAARASLPANAAAALVTAADAAVTAARTAGNAASAELAVAAATDIPADDARTAVSDWLQRTLGAWGEALKNEANASVRQVAASRLRDALRQRLVRAESGEAPLLAGSTLTALDNNADLQRLISQRAVLHAEIAALERAHAAAASYSSGRSARADAVSWTNRRAAALTWSARRARNDAQRLRQGNPTHRDVRTHVGEPVRVTLADLPPSTDGAVVFVSVRRMPRSPEHLAAAVASYTDAQGTVARLGDRIRSQVGLGSAAAEAVTRVETLVAFPAGTLDLVLEAPSPSPRLPANSTVAQRAQEQKERKQHQRDTLASLPFRGNLVVHASTTNAADTVDTSHPLLVRAFRAAVADAAEAGETLLALLAPGAEALPIRNGTASFSLPPATAGGTTDGTYEISVRAGLAAQPDDADTTRIGRLRLSVTTVAYCQRCRADFEPATAAFGACLFHLHPTDEDVTALNVASGATPPPSLVSLARKYGVDNDPADEGGAKDDPANVEVAVLVRALRAVIDARTARIRRSERFAHVTDDNVQDKEDEVRVLAGFIEAEAAAIAAYNAAVGNEATATAAEAAIQQTLDKYNAILGLARARRDDVLNAIAAWRAENDFLQTRVDDFDPATDDEADLITNKELINKNVMIIAAYENEVVQSNAKIAFLESVSSDQTQKLTVVQSGQPVVTATDVGGRRSLLEVVLAELHQLQTALKEQQTGLANVPADAATRADLDALDADSAVLRRIDQQWRDALNALSAAKHAALDRTEADVGAAATSTSASGRWHSTDPLAFRNTPERAVQADRELRAAVAMYPATARRGAAETAAQWDARLTKLGGALADTDVPGGEPLPQEGTDAAHALLAAKAGGFAEAEARIFALGLELARGEWDVRALQSGGPDVTIEAVEDGGSSGAAALLLDFSVSSSSSGSDLIFALPVHAAGGAAAGADRAMTVDRERGMYTRVVRGEELKAARRALEAIAKIAGVDGSAEVALVTSIEAVRGADRALQARIADAYLADNKATAVAKARYKWLAVLEPPERLDDDAWALRVHESRGGGSAREVWAHDRADDITRLHLSAYASHNTAPTVPVPQKNGSERERHLIRVLVSLRDDLVRAVRAYGLAILGAGRAHARRLINAVLTPPGGTAAITDAERESVLHGASLVGEDADTAASVTPARWEEFIARWHDADVPYSPEDVDAQRRALASLNDALGDERGVYEARANAVRERFGLPGSWQEAPWPLVSLQGGVGGAERRDARGNVDRRESRPSAGWSGGDWRFWLDSGAPSESKGTWRDAHSTTNAQPTRASLWAPYRRPAERAGFDIDYTLVPVAGPFSARDLEFFDFAQRHASRAGATDEAQGPRIWSSSRDGFAGRRSVAASAGPYAVGRAVANEMAGAHVPDDVLEVLARDSVAAERLLALANAEVTAALAGLAGIGAPAADANGTVVERTHTEARQRVEDARARRDDAFAQLAGHDHQRASDIRDEALKTLSATDRAFAAAAAAGDTQDDVDALEVTRRGQAETVLAYETVLAAALHRPSDAGAATRRRFTRTGVDVTDTVARLIALGVTATEARRSRPNNDIPRGGNVLGLAGGVFGGKGARSLNGEDCIKVRKANAKAFVAEADALVHSALTDLAYATAAEVAAATALSEQTVARVDTEAKRASVAGTREEQQARRRAADAVRAARGLDGGDPVPAILTANARLGAAAEARAAALAQLREASRNVNTAGASPVQLNRIAEADHVLALATVAQDAAVRALTNARRDMLHEVPRSRAEQEYDALLAGVLRDSPVHSHEALPTVENFQSAVAAVIDALEVTRAVDAVGAIDEVAGNAGKLLARAAARLSSMEERVLAADRGSNVKYAARSLEEAEHELSRAERERDEAEAALRVEFGRSLSHTSRRVATAQAKVDGTRIAVRGWSDTAARMRHDAIVAETASDEADEFARLEGQLNATIRDTRAARDALERAIVAKAVAGVHQEVARVDLANAVAYRKNVQRMFRERAIERAYGRNAAVQERVGGLWPNGPGSKAQAWAPFRPEAPDVDSIDIEEPPLTAAEKQALDDERTVARADAGQAATRSAADARVTAETAARGAAPGSVAAARATRAVQKERKLQEEEERNRAATDAARNRKKAEDTRRAAEQRAAETKRREEADARGAEERRERVAVDERVQTARAALDAINRDVAALEPIRSQLLVGARVTPMAIGASAPKATGLREKFEDVLVAAKMPKDTAETALTLSAVKAAMERASPPQWTNDRAVNAVVSELEDFIKAAKKEARSSGNRDVAAIAGKLTQNRAKLATVRRDVQAARRLLEGLEADRKDKNFGGTRVKDTSGLDGIIKQAAKSVQVFSALEASLLDVVFEQALLAQGDAALTSEETLLAGLKQRLASDDVKARDAVIPLGDTRNHATLVRELATAAGGTEAAPRPLTAEVALARFDVFADDASGKLGSEYRAVRELFESFSAAPGQSIEIHKDEWAMRTFGPRTDPLADPTSAGPPPATYVFTDDVADLLGLDVKTRREKGASEDTSFTVEDAGETESSRFGGQTVRLGRATASGVVEGWRAHAAVAAIADLAGSDKRTLFAKIILETLADAAVLGPKGAIDSPIEFAITVHAKIASSVHKWLQDAGLQAAETRAPAGAPQGSVTVVGSVPPLAAAAVRRVLKDARVVAGVAVAADAQIEKLRAAADLQANPRDAASAQLQAISRGSTPPRPQDAAAVAANWMKAHETERRLLVDVGGTGVRDTLDAHRAMVLRALGLWQSRARTAARDDSVAKIFANFVLPNEAIVTRARKAVTLFKRSADVLSSETPTLPVKHEIQAILEEPTTARGQVDEVDGVSLRDRQSRFDRAVLKIVNGDRALKQSTDEFVAETQKVRAPLDRDANKAALDTPDAVKDFKTQALRAAEARVALGTWNLGETDKQIKEALSTPLRALLNTAGADSTYAETGNLRDVADDFNPVDESISFGQNRNNTRGIIAVSNAIAPVRAALDTASKALDAAATKFNDAKLATLTEPSTDVGEQTFVPFQPGKGAQDVLARKQRISAAMAPMVSVQTEGRVLIKKVADGVAKRRKFIQAARVSLDALAARASAAINKPRSEAEAVFVAAIVQRWDLASDARAYADGTVGSLPPLEGVFSGDRPFTGTIKEAKKLLKTAADAATTGLRGVVGDVERARGAARDDLTVLPGKLSNRIERAQPAVARPGEPDNVVANVDTLAAEATAGAQRADQALAVSRAWMNRLEQRQLQFDGDALKTAMSPVSGFEREWGRPPDTAADLTSYVSNLSGVMNAETAAATAFQREMNAVARDLRALVAAGGAADVRRNEIRAQVDADEAERAGAERAVAEAAARVVFDRILSNTDSTADTAAVTRAQNLVAGSAFKLEDLAKEVVCDAADPDIAKSSKTALSARAAVTTEVEAQLKDAQALKESLTARIAAITASESDFKAASTSLAQQ